MGDLCVSKAGIAIPKKETKPFPTEHWAISNALSSPREILRTAGRAVTSSRSNPRAFNCATRRSWHYRMPHLSRTPICSSASSTLQLSGCGISADEAIGTHFAALLETEADSSPTNDEITIGIQGALEGISWSGHIKRKNAEGQWRDVEAMAIAISPTRGTQGLLCIARDITPIQQAAREANDRTEFAAAVLESLPGRTCVKIGRASCRERV